MTLCFQYLLGSMTGRLPYRAALSLLRFRLNSIPSLVGLWPRNSYLTKAFVPGVSDLDITALVTSLDKKTVHRIVAIHQECKKIFPWIGELNIYSSETLKDFAVFANRFELQRDPELLRRTDLNLPFRERQTEAFLFLLRNMYVDQKKLLSNIEIRVRKWKVHLEATEVKEPQVWTIKNLIDSVLEKSSISLSKIEQMTIEEFIGGDWSASDRDPTRVVAKLFVHFFPDSLSSLSIDPDYLPLIRFQIGWEIFGLYGQSAALSAQIDQHPWINTALPAYEQFCKKYGWSEEVRALRALQGLLS